MIRLRTLGVRVAALAVIMVVTLFCLALPAMAEDTPIQGSGSTWSAIAVDQWRADVARFGLQVDYTPNGSSQGRADFNAGQTDFGVSEIPFESGEPDSRPHVYLPIVAGGTSLMYHLYTAGGQQVRDLNLSSKTAGGIFTGGITYWDDPKIEDENPGLALPHEEITVVVRSDGSGTSAQFSKYLSSMQSSLWHSISDEPFTSLWPTDIDGKFAYQQGSDGVSNYVASSTLGKFSITYVEAGYAKKKGFPVANLLNQSGEYTQPTAKDVALALTHATFNGDGTQNLEKVYRAPESEAYAMSSYSYMIAPTTTANGFTAAKGVALGHFIQYFVCSGQQSAEQLGYSPLPPNLVENAYAAMKKIPGAEEPKPLSECDNPTLKGEGPIDYDDPTPGSTGSDSGSGSEETGGVQTKAEAAAAAAAAAAAEAGTTGSTGQTLALAAPADPATILAAAEGMSTPSVAAQGGLALLLVGAMFGPLLIRKKFR